MKPLWLVGRELSHSPSPAMHNAALLAMGLPAVYAAVAVEPERADATLDLAERTCRGINVTAPYKVRAAERFASALDDAARMCGAVNTAVFTDERCALATNTDVLGLVTAWRRASVDVAGGVVAIVGAGGAARAAVLAAHQAEARAVTISARHPTARAELEAVARRQGLEVVDEPARLVVLAATELADPAHAIAGALRGPGTVHDVRYGQAARSSRDAALRAGHVYLDGSSMLLAQGRAALALFLGGTLSDQAGAAMTAAVSRWLRRS